jgi:lysophospholipase L1-like esterase
MKITKKHIYFVLVVTILTLAGLEIGARLYLRFIVQKSASKKFRFNYFRVVEHIPGFHDGDKNGDWIVINNEGFRRTKDVSQKRPPHTYRIFLMGGSAAHGVSSRDPYPIRHIYMNETIDAYLEKELNQEFPPSSVEVINAAVNGYDVFNHTQYLMTEILDYEPNMIIFFDGINDHFTNNPDYNYLEDYRYQFWKDRLQKPSFLGLFDYFAFYMADYSALFRGYVGRKLETDAISKSITSKTFKEYRTPEETIRNHKIAAKKQFLRSIRMNLDLLHHENVKAILALQPILVLRDKNLLSTDEKAFLREDKNIQILYPTVDSEVKSLAAEYSVDYIDLNIPFNDQKYKNQQLFIDYCHLSPLGGEVSANSLFPIVQERMSDWAASGRP